MASDELHQNYEDLHKGTGEAWASIIKRIEAVGDQALADELRKLHNVSKAAVEEARKLSPRERRAQEAPPSTATAGDQIETAKPAK